MNLPYRSVAKQRHVEDVGISQLDAEQVGRLCLDLGPVADAAVGAIDQPTGGDRRRYRRRASYSRRNTWCEAWEV